jgi:hypothetical protein
MTGKVFDFDAVSHLTTSRTALCDYLREQVAGREIDILPGFSTISLVDRARTGRR